MTLTLRPTRLPVRFLFLAMLLLAPAARAAPQSLSIDAMREHTQALLLIQQVLDWYTRTVGEPSIQAETYKGHEALFSQESVRAAAAALQREKDPDNKRALGFFKAYLAHEHLGQKLSRFDDEVLNVELGTAVTLPWEKAKVPYKQLEILSANEKDAGRRAVIESARARVWKEKLNPILEKKEAEAQRLAKALGYRSYVELAEEFRLVDLRALIVEGERFRAATEASYNELLKEMAHKELGVEPAELRRSDIARLRKAPRFARFFPKELAVPAFLHFLAGIGLDLKTVAGTQVRIDDAMHPLKEPRAACYSVRVPGDIRISVKPTGGIDDFVTFFHEGGHALHYANTTTRVFEFQYLGPYTLTEGLAETFGHVWDDPAWLHRYRDFVVAWNRQHRTSFPLMSEAEIEELVHLRVYEELYFLRRYASAKLIYEAALHGGDPKIWQNVHKGPTSNLQSLYRELFGRAYGFALSEEDALRYLTDVDDLFYSADYTRAFGLAQLVHEALRGKFGADWYGKKEAGALLREQLFAHGNKLQPDEVARLLGYEKLDFRPTEARLNRLLRR